MIPIRLIMKHFLPYRSPDPLYFEGIRLACLTGSNGAGKTSLLDAITWVLWGEARARRADELIHQGETEMYVELDFEQEGRIYRVYRNRKSGARSSSVLNLFILQDSGEPLSINAPSLSQTQDLIISILRMDYHTFINSAYLQQGKADSFTTQKPADRKRILSNILGLERWASYEARAKEKLRGINSDLTGLEAIIQTIDEELKQEDALRREESLAQQNHDEIDAAYLAAEASYQEIASAETDLRHTIEKRASIERRQRELASDLQRTEQDIAAHQERIDKNQGVLDEGEQIEAGYQSLQAAREMDSTLGEKLSAISQIKDDIAARQRELREAEEALERERFGYEQRIQQINERRASIDPEELPRVLAEVKELQSLDAERESLSTQIADLREERSSLQANKDRLTSDGTELNERLDSLHSAEGVTCPLCGQPLDEAQRQQLLSELTETRDDKRAEFIALRDRIKETDELIRANQARISELGDEIARLPGLQSKAGALARQAEDAQKDEDLLLTEQARLNEVAQVIAAQDFAPDLRASLQALLAEREHIGYDSNSHDSARETLRQYSGYEDRHTRLAIAREALPHDLQAMEESQARRARIMVSQQEEDEAMTRIGQEIDQLTLQVEEMRRRDTQLRTLRTEKTQANQRLTIARQKLSSLAAQRTRRDEKLAQREALRTQQSIYQELSSAFSKNGVPAMIIDSAIPELEMEANDLLARMTDGRMHVKMSTQTANVDGSMRETLQIDIADELGTRSYETYSGGENFRINFAIRVAISKMLARRAGAHLRTLFVDEGFGTQDSEGRSKLIEAINTVQKDFDMILIITHIEELRDAFPVHIHIDKTSQGSRIQLA